MNERVVEFQITKNSISGKPVVKAVIPQGSTLDDMIAVQKLAYTDLLSKIGLEGHPGCLSGLDSIVIEERFQDVIRMNF
jgi:hypothetical protein